MQVSRRSLSELLSRRPPIAQIDQIHAQIVTQSLASSRRSLIDSLIHCYLQSKNLRAARALFDRYPSTPTPTLLWNLMIRAHYKLQNSIDSVCLLSRMLAAAAEPDEYTFTFAITASARQESVVCGQTVHAMVIKFGHSLNLFLANSLISMYSIFGIVEDAHQVFDEMSEPDVVSWTSLVSAYAKNGSVQKAEMIFRQMPLRNDVSWVVMVSGFVSHGRYADALAYFHEMLHEVRPNEAAVVCALSACAHLGSLDHGSWIHWYIDNNCVLETSNIQTALIDMYAKCGKIDSARRVFDMIPKPDVQNNTSIIFALSMHGLGEEATRVFRRMLAEKLCPSGITVLGALNGCSHSGLVPHGSLIFYNMETLWGIKPEIEHYGCYVDLLVRAGYLAKAFGIIGGMPFDPDAAIWRALLSACRIHRNVGFGERLVRHLEQLSPGRCAGTDVLLSNMYASLGKWEKVALVRETMDKERNQSDIGCSWIEVKGIVHEFRVADALHPQITDIRNKLAEILDRVAPFGYAMDITRVSFDLSQEDKHQAVAWHSEKLAIAFGIMNTRLGDSIRIVKNLRTCEDCHTALKAISKVYEREIIVRDRSRFHTFNRGECSCKDYW